MDQLDRLLSYYHTFHSPLDDVYNIFSNMHLLIKEFFPNTTLLWVKQDTSIDDIGNELCIKLDQSYDILIKVESSVSKPTFRSFALKSAKVPEDYSHFLMTFKFFWNSIDYVTILHFDLSIIDPLLNCEHIKYLIGDKSKRCSNIEKCLKETLTESEQFESISIQKSIEIVWKFFQDFANFKYFFEGIDDMQLRVGKNSKLTIVDSVKKSEIELNIKANNKTESEKEIELTIGSSTISLPKQVTIILLIKINEERTFFGFKTIIQQYIDCDILKTGLENKRTVLLNIKKVIEGN